jgi:hypothetical protein
MKTNNTVESDSANERLEKKNKQWTEELTSAVYKLEESPESLK